MDEHTIFLAALEIADSKQRAAFLDRACGGDPSVRKQVDALFAAHERSGEFLDVPALKQIAGDSGSGSADEVTCGEHEVVPGEIDLSFLEPPTERGSLGRIKHYEIRKVIGRGGCGIVLKAFDEKLERIVAVKIIAPELAATSPARKRFLREARATAAIRHENVVSIYAVEEQPLPFLVMEYIDGRNLQQKLDENGPLDPQDVLRISRQIASGLEAAHAKGLIHRDIKPGNILLEDGTDHLKITDFGLARLADDASMTQSGVIAGTPLYMSPEQAQGHDIDQRSDLFSLRSVLYVMCSGRPPFRAASTLAVMKRVVEEQPRPIQGIISEVPGWLVAIIAILHAKDPRKRFASARVVGDLLGNCLAELEQRGRVELPQSVLDMIPQREGDQSAADYEAVGAEARPRRHSWRRNRVAAAILLAILTGLSITEATSVTNVRGTMIRLFSPEGTLIVELDDPEVSLTIDGTDLVLTGAGVKEIRLKPGHYNLQTQRNGEVVRQEVVTVTRRGRRVVRVSRETNDSAGEPGVLATSDPDRAAAAWLISNGGFVQTDLAEQWTRTAPTAPFRLTGVNVEHKHETVTNSLAELLGSCPELRSLNLRWTGTTDAGLKHLENCTKLTHLALGPGITDEGLAAFQNCRGLVTLNLTGGGITDDGIARLANNASLQVLWLNHTSVTEKGLAALGPLPQLENLDVGWTQISDAGLAQLRDYPKLQTLSIGPDLSDEGLAQLKGLSGLTSLTLVGRQGEFTASGVANFRGCQNLEHLRLSWNAGSDAVMAEIKSWPALNRLTLSEALVTDEGLSHLEECRTLTSLVISTKGPGVSKAKVEELRMALPDCNIRWTNESN